MNKVKELDELIIEKSGSIVISADIAFVGTTPPMFLLSLEKKTMEFSEIDKVRAEDLIEFVEDSSDDLDSEYER